MSEQTNDAVMEKSAEVPAKAEPKPKAKTTSAKAAANLEKPEGASVTSKAPAKPRTKAQAKPKAPEATTSTKAPAKPRAKTQAKPKASEAVSPTKAPAKPRAKAQAKPKVSEAATSAKAPVKPRAKTQAKPKTSEAVSPTKAPAKPRAEAEDVVQATDVPNKVQEEAAGADKLSNKEKLSNPERDAPANKIPGPNPVVGFTYKNVLSSAGKLARQAITNPKNTIKHQLKYAGRIGQVMLGETVIEPNARDARFKDPAWTGNPLYRRWQQLYLVTRGAIADWITDSGLNEKEQRRAQFIVDMVTETAAPSNTLLNPTAVKKMFDTGGKSTIQGLKHLIDDFVHEGGMPSMVDKSAFTVGDNLATTPGQVIFRNDVLELIQYNPTTEKVHERPLLIVPPQINKFYVFDLSPHNSMAKFTLESGLQAFVISWKNPTRKQSHWGMDTYVTAILEAIDVITDITSSKDVNILGACSGGATTAALLSYVTSKNLPLVHSATLLVSVFDSDTDSLLGLFATEETLELARQRSAIQGILPGKQMAKVFAWLRPNDLIWNYWVNNYLLGNKPPKFDVLYWNADSTNLPARFHAELLEVMRTNQLATPGAAQVLDEQVDLSKVTCDFYSLAGTTDHITPWGACYKSARLLGGKSRYILSTSGHIQSILNPPGNPKSKFYTNDDYGSDPEAWLKGAKQNEGTWWFDWQHWIQERSGAQVEAPAEPGNEDYPALVASPGTYVFE